MKKFEKGSLVCLRAPATPKEIKDFCTGWYQDGMGPWNGKIAKVLEVSPSGACLVCPLDEIEIDKETQEETPLDSWWWDPKYIDNITQLEEISEDEYANILFEG